MNPLQVMAARGSRRGSESPAERHGMKKTRTRRGPAAGGSQWLIDSLSVAHRLIDSVSRVKDSDSAWPSLSESW